MRVLVISRDDGLTEGLARELTTTGHELIVQAVPDEAAPQSSLAEVVVFDLCDATPLRWRQLSLTVRGRPVPHIVLGACDRTQDDPVRALRLGADDYLPRPISIAELAVRAERVADRVTAPQASAAATVPYEVVLDPSSRVAVVRGRHVRLTPSEFRLLEQLVREKGKPVRRQDLMTLLKGCGSTARDQGLSLYIWSLRQKIEDDPARPQMILTRRGHGYLFSARAPKTRHCG